jgi:hypothetical protein
MAEHLDPHTIITLALRGESHPHLERCAACRTLHVQARSLAAFDPEAANGDLLPADEGDTFVSPPAYRLAAQDVLADDAPVVVRRTWYLDNATVLVRVIDDHDEQCLYGHVITDPLRLAGIAIRFSGIDADFLPDERGMFRIGASDLAIETMDATLLLR